VAQGGGTAPIMFYIRYIDREPPMRLSHTDPSNDTVIDFNWCKDSDRFIHKTVRFPNGFESHSTISRWTWDSEVTERVASGWRVEFWDMIQTDRNPMTGAC